MINLATILLLLQMVMGLYQSPDLNSTPALKMQVDAIAVQAMDLANQALTAPSSTPLGTATTTTSTQQITVAPQDQNTPLPSPVFGATTPITQAPQAIAPQITFVSADANSITFKFEGGSYDSFTGTIVSSQVAVSDSPVINDGRTITISTSSKAYANEAIESYPAITFTGLNPNTYYKFSYLFALASTTIPVNDWANYKTASQ